VAERHVGFIRAVMQGREGLTRHVLLDAVRAAGGEEPSTHRSTGNVSFTAGDGEAVCTALAQRLALVVDRDTPVLHRSLAQVRELVQQRPFARSASGEHLVVLAAVDLAAVVAQLALPDELDLVHVAGCDACFVRAAPRGAHPMPLLEAAGVHPVTSRSIGTLEHIAERAGQ
jgi:uncharacterized protein (DUF1697 family)